MATNKVDTIKVVDGRLVIDVALAAPSKSASGKSTVFYSTRGNKAVEGGYFIGLNLYKKEE